MKQPRMAAPPLFAGNRPCNKDKPSAATARIASAVPTGPKATSVSHSRDAAIEPLL